MFDLILDKVDRQYRKASTGATVTSLLGHVLLITLVFVLPILYATNSLPRVPAMMAFVVTAAETSPPPPPPPPPPPARAVSEVSSAPAAVSTNPNAAPIEAPAAITQEPPAPPSAGSLLGGVEGGIEGGVVGGIVGGLVAAPSPPPPPPPPPAPPAPRASAHEPVRIGGVVVAPALVRRVEPEYPTIAVAAHLEGLVILEATVDTEGRVQEVRILRSRGLLDKAAIEAVSRWRYAPLLLNGIPMRFVLTVTLNFSLTEPTTKDVG